LCLRFSSLYVDSVSFFFGISPLAIVSTSFSILHVLRFMYTFFLSIYSFSPRLNFMIHSSTGLVLFSYLSDLSSWLFSFQISPLATA
jgi:hypothetical protein